MKKSIVFIGIILGLFLNAFPWPEAQTGATQTTPVLIFKKNSFKSFSNPTPSGGKYVTFEAAGPVTLDNFADGIYSSFVVDASNMSMASTVLLAYNTGLKFKIDYAKDADFMGRSVMFVKVFSLQE